MIIFRYLARELLTSSAAITLVLLLVIVSSRFGRYLNEAVSGRISADILLSVIALRIPVILELVVPLSFFIALLFALGRLHVDNEMTALNACGFSRRRLLAYLCGPSLLVACAVGGLSLWISPLSLDRSNTILEQERARSEFETLRPGQFQDLSDEGSTIYVESLSSDAKELRGVFAADMRVADSVTSFDSNTVSLISATSGRQVFDDQFQRRYLVIENGQRVQGVPGQSDFRVVQFASFAQEVEQPDIRYKSAHDRMSTQALMAASDSASTAALHWRLGLPVLVMVLALLGVPLAQTDPRRGRYTKMIPAVLLYMGYLIALNAARGAVEDGNAGASVMWLVHLIMVAIGLFLFNAQAIGRFFTGRRARTSVGGAL